MSDQWLLIGGDSEIGAATLIHARERGRSVSATTRREDSVSATRPFLDLSQSLEDWEPPDGTSAACIFAAFARLGACHSDPAGSAQINVTQTLALTEKLLQRGIHVLYLSTNQVFDGREPHVAAGAPMCPISEYGRQKARTERALQEHMAKEAPLAILRLAKVLSPGAPLVTKWIDTLTAGTPIQAFSDMSVAPTRIDTVISVISALLGSQSRGIFQLTGTRDVTYLQVGRYLARRLGADTALVRPVSASMAGLPPGSTPLHTTLDSKPLESLFGISASDPWDVMKEMLTSR